jgi:hypothetical protein
MMGAMRKVDSGQRALPAELPGSAPGPSAPPARGAAPVPELPPAAPKARPRGDAVPVPAVGRPSRKAAERPLGETIRWAGALGGRALLCAATLWAAGCASLPRAQLGPSATGRMPPAPTSMSQLDYPDVDLGNGGYRTIAQAGCFLTSLAMASECLTGQRWDPVTANAQVKQAGAFRGAGLEMPDAAQALGLRVTWRGALDAGDAQAKQGSLRAHLGAGQVAVACVDLGPGSTSGVSEGDHFILIDAAGPNGTFFGVDPAGGVRVRLTSDEQGFLRYGADGSRRVCELVLVEKK